MTDEQARLSEICPACKKPKALELVVCWTCFKYREDVIPFKYFEGKDSNDLLQEWLDYVRKSKKPDCIRCDLYRKEYKCCVYGSDCPVKKNKT